jgi:hypothetical protein
VDLPLEHSPVWAVANDDELGVDGVRSRLENVAGKGPIFLGGDPTKHEHGARPDAEFGLEVIAPFERPENIDLDGV